MEISMEQVKELREKTGILPDYHINRYDSKPFDPMELANEINEILG